jgi:hypothetical protein
MANQTFFPALMRADDVKEYLFSNPAPITVDIDSLDRYMVNEHNALFVQVADLANLLRADFMREMECHVVQCIFYSEDVTRF